MSDLIFLTIVSFVCYVNSLNGQFVFDDISAIVNNEDVVTSDTSLSSLWSLLNHDFWGTPITSEHSHKSYRPLTVITFRLNYAINGVNPLGYHAINVILHILVVRLYLKLCHTFGMTKDAALIAGLLFAAHPIHTEAVTGVVGRAELLSTIFYFLSLFSYIKHIYWQFILQVICAILSKEQGITVIGVCMTLELCQCLQRKNLHTRMIKIMFLMVFGIILLSSRIWIMGGRDNFPVFTKFDNPASFAATPQRQLTYNYLLAFNTFLILFPFHLCCDWTMKSIPLIESAFELRNVFTLIFYIILIALLIRSLLNLLYNECNNLVKILSIIVFPFIPASNIFFPVGFVIAERTLYIPSAGFYMLIAYGWQQLTHNYSLNYHKKLIKLLLCTTIFAFTLKTLSRNWEWNNELSLFSSGIKVNPNNAKLYNNIGHYYERQRNFTAAIGYFRAASEHQSDDLGSSINIARTLINLGHLEESEKLLWSIKPRVKLSAINKRIVPSYLNLWINLGNIIGRNESRLSEAEALYKELIVIRSDFVDAYINLGDILIRETKLTEAIYTYNRGLSIALAHNNNKISDLYYNLGVAYSMLLRDKSPEKDEHKNEIILQIAEYFANATKINRSHKEAMVNLAIMIQRNYQLLNSFRGPLIQKMKQYTSAERELVLFNLALLLSDDGDNNGAAYYLQKAIEIKSDFRGALFNLALIRIDQKNYADAAKFLNQLIVHHPNHTKSLLLLGDLYINQLLDLDNAENCYLKILKYNNTNFEAIHNLCVIYSKRNKTLEARECFQKVSSFNFNFAQYDNHAIE